MVRVNTTQISESAAMTNSVVSTVREADQATHTVGLSESVKLEACGVISCISDAEVTIKVPSMKGKVETVSLCQKCHGDYQLQFWI